MQMFRFTVSAIIPFSTSLSIARLLIIFNYRPFYHAFLQTLIYRLTLSVPFVFPFTIFLFTHFSSLIFFSFSIFPSSNRSL